MHKTEIFLKLLFDKLGISSDIKTLNDRKRLQKAIYLAKTAGAVKRYTFGWYQVGPYSPELMKDCHRLTYLLSLGRNNYEKYNLHPAVSRKLKPIIDLMQTPSNVNLPQEDWLELLASIAYPCNEKEYAKEEIVNKIKSKRDHLIPHFDTGFNLLQERQLILPR